jgi:uncharacterized protein (TIGR02271 family)
MSRTVTALFDTRSEAEAAKTRLTSSRIDADNIRIIDKQSGGSSSGSSGGSSSSGAGSSSGGSSDAGNGQGFWGSLKDMFMPDEDRHAYGEGISRGGFMLCAQVDEDETDEAIQILDESNSVDFDKRQDEWRSSGWTGYNSDAGSGMFGSENTTGTGATAGGMTGGLATGATGMPLTGQSSGLGTGGGTTGTEDRERSNVVQEEHIPIVEEELRVGKREVNRGGARVRSYAREVPVHEQVSLREEHVSIERRPVNETLGTGQLSGADAFQERTIDMTETSEEAVVAKEAKVREELVVKKTAEEHVENIDETVRRTEVDVEEGETGSDNRSAFGSFGSGSSGGGTGMDNDSERNDLERTDRDKSGF